MNSSCHVNGKEASPSTFIKITVFSNLKIVHTLETGPESPLECISVIQPLRDRLWVVINKSFWSSFDLSLVVSPSSTIVWPRSWWNMFRELTKLKQTNHSSLSLKQSLELLHRWLLQWKRGTCYKHWANPGLKYRRALPSRKATRQVRPDWTAPNCDKIFFTESGAFKVPLAMGVN